MRELPDYLFKQFHPTLNGELKPDKVSAGSSKNIWWLGDCNHAWPASPSNRTRMNSGCPYCAGQKVLAGFNDIGTTHPWMEEIWHPDNVLSASQVLSGNKKLFKWLEKCGHSYMLAPCRREKAKRCQVCANRIIVSGVNDLSTMRPDIAKEWHPIKNGELLPTQFSIGNPKKFWWICFLGHEWEAVINDRVHDNSECPTCKNKKVLIGFNDLATTHMELSKEWHPTKNGKLKPFDVVAGSDKSVWWLCSNNHEWETPLYSRTGKLATGCASCNGRKIWVGVTDLATKRPHLASEWHPTKNGSLLPSDFSYSSSQKVWWLCHRKHEWESTIGNRSAGKGCLKCSAGNQSSLVEDELMAFIESLGVDLVKTDRDFLKGQEIDAYSLEYKVAFEFNGLYWHTDAKKPFDYHHKKRETMKSLGYTLVQIWEDNWRDNQHLVKLRIAQILDSIIRLPDESHELTRYEIEGLTIGVISAAQALPFLKAHRLHGDPVCNEATVYVGATNGSELKAVLAVSEEMSGAATLTYAEDGLVTGLFTKLVTFTQEQNNFRSLTILSSNDMPISSYLKKSGFVLDSELPASSLFFYKKNRHMVASEKGSEIRIWDSGTGVWKLSNASSVN